MENLIEYMDESLVPLEEKVKEYLHTEREIRLLEVELLSLQRHWQVAGAAHAQEEHPVATADEQNDEKLNAAEQKMQQLLEQYEQLQQEVIRMLPEQNKFVELDLGYGPSQVGYFTIDHETHQQLPEPILRVVH
ncbi:hypothetical protein [Pontibacter ruber]|uniref:Uncharacterized protein n=1 Tax=Pontibacter ruber TaxID=1343895 RepID=A0ABW5CY21_9BACT|nr:hypothetical protein [Pontibacter ruber]